ncbi:MAG: amidohydrolase family protein, partial [Anaerolineae bacterium]|nr:amidohydrolase family protein [Anaerolineae bacterium]
MIVRDDYYDRVDMAVYREVVRPLLSEKILDFHVHVWRPTDEVGQYPGIWEVGFGFGELLETARLMFPEQEYHAVVFGRPTLEGDRADDLVVHGAREHSNLYPLYIPDMHASEQQVRRTVRQGGFFGFKPYWNLVEGKSSQDDVTIRDMLPQPYTRVADDWGLIIMLHIPGSGRLADPRNLSDIRWLSAQCPNAKIVIAHLGRSYCLWSIKGNLEEICDLPNVYFGVSFVQEAIVYKVLFDHVDPAKILYGSDLPLSRLRGRRVCMNGQWVDVTREPWAWAAHRDDAHPIEATFMTYEMIRALREGAEAAGLSSDEIEPIFYENGMRLIEDTRRALESLA